AEGGTSRPGNRPAYELRSARPARQPLRCGHCRLGRAAARRARHPSVDADIDRADLRAGADEQWRSGFRDRASPACAAASGRMADDPALTAFAAWLNNVRDQQAPKEPAGKKPAAKVGAEYAR